MSNQLGHKMKLASLKELARERTLLEERDTRRAYLIMALLADMLLIFIQLWLSLNFKGVQYGDAASYLDLASYCAEHHTWYPGTHDMFAYYIFGNGYVNILSVFQRICPSVHWVYLLNILFTQVIVLCTADIAAQLTGRMQTGCIAMTMVCLMGGIWGEAVVARTELCFMAFALLSISFLMRSGWGFMLLAGLAFGVANWVRPLLVIYVPGMLFYLLMKRTSFRRIAVFFAGIAIVIALCGTASYQRIGKFIYQAQTMGINMLMGANDEADGSYMSVVEEGEPGHIQTDGRGGFTFDEYDAEFKSRAIAWILENPIDFLLLVPAKLFYFLATDTYGGTSFFDNAIETDNLAYILSLKDILLGRGERALAFGDLIVIWSQAWYMAVFALYLLNILSSIKKRYVLDMGMLHIIFILACGVTVMTVGGARYHMPYLPVFAIGAAVQIDLFKGKSKK